jgi:hypothetical protein
MSEAESGSDWRTKMSTTPETFAGQHNSMLVTKRDDSYKALCEDLGGDRRMCLLVRTMIFVATLTAPPGSLTIKDAIAIASLLISVGALFLKKIIPHVQLNLVCLHIVLRLHSSFSRTALSISNWGTTINTDFFRGKNIVPSVVSCRRVGSACS